MMSISNINNIVHFINWPLMNASSYVVRMIACYSDV